jgi:succinate dehydrogenase hydrophobic anchor subunit
MQDFLFEFIAGLILLIFGIWFFAYNLKETKGGYRSRAGNDIKLYTVAILSIIFGCVLLYRAIF